MKSLDERIHKEIKPVFDQLKPVPLVTRDTAPEAYAAREKMMRAYARPHEDVSVTERHIPGQEGDPDILIRIFQKAGRTEKAPLVMFMHGGGMYLGSATSEESGAVRTVRANDCVVIMPEYRMSWRAPFPAALNDCYAALCWSVEHANELNIDADRVILFGVSAGSNLVCGLSTLARDKGFPKILAQVPLQPMLDYRCNTNSMKEFTDLRCWNAPQAELAWEMYLGDSFAEPISPYASPLYAEDFSNLPPTYFYVGELDPFRDEAILYAQKLMEAGNFVDYQIVGGAYHGFEAAMCPLVQKCLDGVTKFIADAFQGNI